MRVVGADYACDEGVKFHCSKVQDADDCGEAVHGAHKGKQHCGVTLHSLSFQSFSFFCASTTCFFCMRFPLKVNLQFLTYSKRGTKETLKPRCCG